MGGLLPWTQRLREMVRNGPSPFDRVLVQMSVQVPPGRAFRDSVSRADWSRKRAHGATNDIEERDVEKVARELNDTERNAMVRQGQRRIAYQTIWTQKRQGVIDIVEQGGVKMIVQGPRFPAEK